MDMNWSRIRIFWRIFRFSSEDSFLWTLGCIFSVLFLKVTESSSFSRVSTPIGLKARLLCSTEITGSIHVQWLDPSGTTLTYDDKVETGDSRFKIDHSYLKEWNLEIDNVRRSDSGNYTCSIGPTPIVNRMVELIVVVAPSLLRTSGDVASAAGSSVRLYCEASGEPQPTITWTRLSPSNGSKLDLKIEGSELNISSVTVEDAGTYECQANNNVPPAAFGRMRLEILFGPEITVLFREISQEEGGSTLLTCLVRSNPAKELFWERNGTVISHSNAYQVLNWETGEYQTTLGLLITRLIASDFGDYKCKAANQFGEAEGSIRINEYETGKVRILSTPKDSLAKVGGSVLLECSANGLDHGNYLIWWRILSNGSNRMIFISHFARTAILSSMLNMSGTFQFDHMKYEIRGHYSLFIKQVNFSDGGTYVCDISGQQNYSAELSVIGEKVSCGNNRTDVGDGDSVMLVCSLTYRGLAPNWRISWMHEEQPVSSIDESSYGLIRRTLLFNASYPQSIGTYRCAIADPQLEHSSSCRVELNVLSSKTGGFVIPENPCENRNGTAQFCSYISSTMVIIILASVVAALFALGVIIVCCVVTYHRQEMAKYKEPLPKSNKSTRNGNVDIELTPLTCSSPSPQPPA